MPGPPPARHPRRRNARPDWRRLPSAGRQGDPPPYPLSRPAKTVVALWAELWACPQAAAWEDLGWTRIVARYAKLLIAAERANAPAALLAEVRHLEDRLGLTPMAMRRLQWETEAPAADRAPDAAEADGDLDPVGPGASVTDIDEYRDLYG